MIYSLSLNDKQKSFNETWEKAYEAKNIFLQLQDEERKAETTFMFGVIYRK